MKICFIDWFAYPLFNPRSKIVFGGAQIQLYLISQELSKNRQLNISFLTDNNRVNRVEKFGKIKVYQLFKSWWPLGYWQFFFRLLIQLKKIKADYFIQRAASAETGLIALISKILNRKFIFMVAHEQDVNNSFIERNGWRGKLFSLGLKLADKIICQTKEQQKQLRTDFQAKSIIIQSGWPIKPKKKISQEKKGILWVSRAEDWKNPVLLLQLAKKFPKEKFIMICPPAEDNKKYFKLIQKEAKKIPNINFIQQVPFRTIDEYFAKAKIFISTSLSEGFPNTFIQAAKNMTPIISFKINPDKIIDKYKIGFYAQGNEKRLAFLLKKIIKNNKLQKQLGINAYRYAKRFHDIKKIAVNIFDNIF